MSKATKQFLLKRPMKLSKVTRILNGSNGQVLSSVGHPGVVHDSVRHSKKRVKVGRKWVWKKPTYTKLVTHVLPDTKKKLRVKTGTQIIDRA